MHRIGLSLLAVAMFAGCEQPKMTMDMFAQPEKAAELGKLERFVGNWSGTAEMVSPTAEEMNEMIEGGTVPKYFKGGGDYKWVLDGRFLMSDGWHEMPNGNRANYISFMTWDSKAKKYRSWYFSDYGKFGDGTMKFTGDNTIKSKASGVGAGGDRMSGEGTMTFDGDNRIDWTWAEGNLFYKMKIKGSSTKQ